MALAALGVLIVPSTRCPVSLASRAMRTVSVSRSSPMTMTSGSSRREALSAVWKERVWVPTSRWLMRARLRGWMNSMGSSTVITWRVVSVLRMSTTAASVVVLPCPMGPVSTMSPWWWRVAPAMAAGSPRNCSVGMYSGMRRSDAFTPPR